MFKKTFIYALNAFILILNLYILCFSNILFISKFMQVICAVFITILFFLTYIFKYKNYIKSCRIMYVIFLFSSIIIFGLYILNKYNLLDVFTSATTLKNYIISTGGMGIFVYILLQTLQVIFLPIPAAIICIVGSMIYGPILGGIYCSIGVLLGSYISFILGKTFGLRLVKWIVGEENAKKYSLIIRNKGGMFLCLAFLLPMFPDDILCLIAGMTDMRYKSFFIITLITRPIGVICMSFFGGGHVIPFSGWGIYVWGVILIVSIILMIVVYRYQERMQNYLISKIKYRRTKHNN